jgi:hypothetical protein
LLFYLNLIYKNFYLGPDPHDESQGPEQVPKDCLNQV